MEFAAKPGRVYKPRIKVSGDGDIDITSVTAILEVGRIPSAVIGAPPEYSEGLLGHQTNKKFTVTVEGEKVFTGYIAGPSGSQTDQSVSHANSLIHLSRDLDQCRMWSPGIHPMSTDDWAFYQDVSDVNSPEGGRAEAAAAAFNIKGDALDETKKVVKAMLDAVLRVPKSGLYGDVSGLQAEASAAASLLDRYYPLTPCRIDSAISSASMLIPLSAARYMAEIMSASRNSNRSVWDTVQMMLSVLGLTTTCTPDGKVGVMPVLSGCTPPDSNSIGDEWIQGYDYVSTYGRNVRDVLLISYASSDIVGLPGGSEESGAAGKTVTRWIKYPKKSADDPGSGSIVMPVPRWLTPEVGKANPGMVDAGVPDSVLEKYAQSVFFEHRNAGRSVRITTPFCPDALPGTTVFFHPASTMRPFSGQKIDQGPKAGYVWKVAHTANSESRAWATEWSIRSIYLNSEFGKMLASPPFFSDSSKPFKL